MARHGRRPRSRGRTPRRSIAQRHTPRGTSPRTSSRPVFADKCEVQVAYAIGVARPVSVDGRDVRDRGASAARRSSSWSASTSICVRPPFGATSISIGRSTRRPRPMAISAATMTTSRGRSARTRRRSCGKPPAWKPSKWSRRGFRRMETVGIVGAGFMGLGHCGSRRPSPVFGLSCTSQRPLRLRGRARRRVAASLDRAVSRGKAGSLTPRPTHCGAARSPRKLVDLRGCDVVIEAVTEDECIKSEVFRRLDAGDASRGDPGVETHRRFRSPTLRRRPSRPDRMLGLHFFSPVPVMELVEVVPALATRSRRP